MLRRSKTRRHTCDILYAMQLNNPNTIARTLGHYLQLTGDPETVNNVYELYDSVTQNDIVAVVRRYFSSDNSAHDRTE